MTTKSSTREGKIIHFGIPEDLHNKAKHRAIDEKKTLRDLFVKAMEEYLERAEAEEK